MGQPKDISGKRFGRLLAMKPTNKRDTHGCIIWKFYCDCGKFTHHVGYRVANGNIKSCGCSRKKEAQSMGLKNMFSDYKGGAWARGLKFQLNFAAFKALTQNTCNYCGSEPEKRHRKVDFTANGIDRLDPNKGYIKRNVVTCCSTCNRAKGTLGLEEFEAWITKVINYRRQQNEGLD